MMGHRINLLRDRWIGPRDLGYTLESVAISPDDELVAVVHLTTGVLLIELHLLSAQTLAPTRTLQLPERGYSGYRF